MAISAQVKGQPLGPSTAEGGERGGDRMSPYDPLYKFFFKSWKKCLGFRPIYKDPWLDIRVFYRPFSL